MLIEALDKRPLICGLGRASQRGSNENNFPYTTINIGAWRYVSNNASMEFEMPRSWKPHVHGLASTNDRGGIVRVVSTAASLRLGSPTIAAQPNVEQLI